MVQEYHGLREDKIGMVWGAGVSMIRRLVVWLSVIGLSMLAGVLPGSAQTWSAKLAATVSTDSSAWQALVFWQQELARASQERLTVQMFPEAQLGMAETILSGVRFGHIEMALMPVDHLLKLAPELSAIATSALFRDAGHRANVLHGPLGQGLLANLRRYRIRGMGFFDAEPQVIVSFQEPFTTLEAFQGAAIGVAIEQCEEPEADQLETSRPRERDDLTLPGAHRVPVCPEQQAQAITSGDLAGWLEALRSWNRLTAMLPEHAANAVFRDVDPPLVLIVNTVWFDALDPEDQTLLMDTTRLAARYQRQIADELLQTQMAAMQAAGFQSAIVETNLFYDAAQPVFERLRAELGEDFEGLLQAIAQVK